MAHGDKISYDLRSLKTATFSVISTLQSATNVSFELSPCGLFTAQHCRYTECRESAYMFGRFPTDRSNDPRTLGTFLQFEAVEDQWPHTFNLVYTLGSNLPPGCTKVNTTIQFYCDIPQEQGTPKLVSNVGKCTNTFNWHSAWACPVCRASDIMPSKGTCTNGMRQVIYAYKSPCFSQSPLPAPTQEKCAEVSLGVGAVVAISLASLCVLVGVGGAAFWFYKQRRETEIKYQALQTDAGAEDLAL